ncbi:MAG: FHA domain-containing protein [Anaerolineaceae bacterium]|nr:MAG: FHA domain-containing protein [Anaerolineaceae bacterium]
MEEIRKCKDCGQVNQPDAQICVICGALLADTTQQTSTKSLEDADYEEGRAKWGSARFNARTLLMLGVDSNPTTFQFVAEDIDELIIGREDSRTGNTPAINLTQYGALEKGVSRDHARIVRRDGSLQLVDNDSRNGTYLNGQRLVPNQPRILRDGDDLRLGKLVMRITYQEDTNTDS